jgi:hypothetical protein
MSRMKNLRLRRGQLVARPGYRVRPQPMGWVVQERIFGEWLDGSYAFAERWEAVLAMHWLMTHCGDQDAVEAMRVMRVAGRVSAHWDVQRDEMAEGPRPKTARRY